MTMRSATWAAACDMFAGHKTKLKRRYERQSERLLGPAWRYTVAGSAPPSVVALMKAACRSAPSRSEFRGCKSVSTERRKTTHSIRSQVNASVHGSLCAGRVAKDPFSKRGEGYFGSSSDAYNCASADPLVEFLKQDDEEAVVLLAMWTSLRRCCTHASEMSEYLSLSVRWCFHRLIRMRAITAAVHFYYRLLSLGVHLQQWDVLLLLKSLPYEHYTAVVDFRKESEKRYRNPNVKRGRPISSIEGNMIDGEEEGGVDSGYARRSDGSTGSKNLSGPTLETSTTEAFASLSANHSVGAAGSSSWKARTTETNLDDGGNEFLNEQPEWVKRWIFYEASMGNVDLYGSGGSYTSQYHCAGSTTPTRSQDGAKSASFTSSVLEEVNNIVIFLNHLVLLHDGARVVAAHPGAGPSCCLQRDGVTVRRASQRRYWAEALQIAGLFLTAQPAKVAEGMFREDVVCASSALRTVFIRAVCASNSWRVALQCLQVSNSYGLTFTKGEYMKLFLPVAVAEPWIRSRVVERFVARSIIPELLGESSNGYACRALWLAHASYHKGDSIDSYIDFMHDSATTLPGCVRRCMVDLKLAVSLLYIDVSRRRTTTADQQVQAPSVRLGIYFSESNPGSSGGWPRHGFDKTDASNGADNALLPLELQDSFILQSLVLSRVVALASVCAASQGDFFELSTLLADVLYGHRGLWGMFFELYVARDGNHEVAHHAPERSRIGCYVTLCLLEVVIALFGVRGTSRHAGQGARMLEVTHISFFLGLLAEAIGTISAHEARKENLLRLTPVILSKIDKLTKVVFIHLRIYPCNEKVLFGSVSEEVVDVLALLLRIQLLASRRVGSSHQHVNATTRSLLRIVLRPGSALSKHLTNRLTHHQRHELESLLSRPCRKRDLKTSTSACGASKPRPKMRVSSPEGRAAAGATAGVHTVVYNLVLRQENSKAALERELTAHLHRVDWVSALIVLRVVLQLKLPSRTLTVHFFASVLSRLCVEPRQTRTSLWLQAAGVFWEAVNHTTDRSKQDGGSHTFCDQAPVSLTHERCVLTELLVPLVRICVLTGRRDVGWDWVRRFDAMRESVGAGVGHEVVSVQAKSVLGDRHALDKCIGLLQRCCHPGEGGGTPLGVTLDTLLCDVAARHPSWHVALQALHGHFFKTDLSDCSFTARLPLPAAEATLRILFRAPTNLSNTALRLWELQGEIWNLACANALLLILVRQRRWILALKHAAEMFPAVKTATIKSSERKPADVATFPKDDENKEKIFFLLHSLRACATGGRTEEAAELYDCLKGLLETTGSQQEATRVDNGGAVDRTTRCVGDMDLLMSSCGEQPAQLSNYGNDERMRLVVRQARAYFLRAMTKVALSHKK
uniref:Uncharacterized protein n=1 Tax=Trypanosoma congolense (strain IL3000) TaxID=1068625 RepID=G0UWC8_TRYCI|nr:conserved hypothetical protein [Trypanosoma congolense IL3000]